MASAFELARFTLDFLSFLKKDDPEWQKKKLNEIAELKEIKASNDLNLKKKLDVLQVELEGEVNRAKMREAALTKDYELFLNSLAEMRQDLMAAYTDMPKPMVFIIYNHAKQLLDDYWATDNETSQAVSRAKLAEFMETVYYDSARLMVDEDQPKLPTDTLRLIKKATG